MYSLQRWCLLPLGAKFYFDSFADSSASDFYGSGTVVTTGQKEGDYTEVKVTSDSNHQEFVGRTFWVESDAKTDGSEVYQLYTDGETATGVYVKIYADAPKRTVNITVNDGTDPIQSATVVIGETTKTTGSAGGCAFNDITDGDVSITVSKEGYTTKTESISVAYDSTTFTISLTVE